MKNNKDNFMNEKIKIYCDNGADINVLKKKYPNNIIYFQYPYDSNSRPKKLKKDLAIPSALTWATANTTWEESTFTWDDCQGSEIYTCIEKLVGKSNFKDILHLDSAYKTKCDIFLTSDKTDIANKNELEKICKYKIFFHKAETEIIEYVEKLIKEKGLR